MEQISLFNIEKPIIETITIDVQTHIEALKTLKVLSLFSGCGGLDLGVRGDFESLGNKYEKNPYEIVFANDIVQKACDTYEYNFGHKAICGDIRDIDLNLLPEVDIVIGGFPCQDFSLAGKRKGLSAERGRLYLEMKRVIEYCKPIAFIAENVDGLRIIKTGQDTTALDVIIDEFRSIGYNVVYNVLNAADYGVPQSRIRVMIVGIKADLKLKMKYPSRTHGEFGKQSWITAKQAIDDLWDKLSKTDIPNHTINDYSRAKFYPGKKMQGNCQIAGNKPSPTIRSEHHGNIEGHFRSLDESDPNNMEKWRRLSVRECARLQTFPDNFEFPCSSSDAYKQIGNAVPPVLGWHVARALYLSLNEKDPEN